MSRLTRVLLRIWSDETIDVVLVTRNNLKELSAIIDRLYAFTSLPFHLIVCDNASDRETKEYLNKLWREKSNLTVVHNGTNALVGPGTNRALESGWSDIAIYVCGKEGFVFRSGWEVPFVHVMSEQPDVGLCGTLCHAPMYLLGSQYPSEIKDFANFRNPQFALEHSTRVFHHVQGGLFALRRRMVEEIGGFNAAVPHNYTDVEYSYYAESKGWKLAQVPHVLSIYRKPSHRCQHASTIRSMRPIRPGLRIWDRSTNHQKEHVHCNVCGVTAEKFSGSKSFPRCSSFRFLHQQTGRSTAGLHAQPCYIAGFPRLPSALEGTLPRFGRGSFRGRFIRVRLLRISLPRRGGWTIAVVGSTLQSCEEQSLEVINRCCPQKWRAFSCQGAYCYCSTMMVGMILQPTRICDPSLTYGQTVL